MPTSSTESPIDPKALLGASKQDLVDLAKKLRTLKHQAAQYGPQTDDELHELIKKDYGVHVPRIAVTEGHCAPFDFVSDAYFQRYTSQLVIANREGMKTFGVGIVQVLWARFFPGYEGLTAGAIEYQTVRAYQAVKKLNARRNQDVDSSQQSKTEFKNSSVIEILTMTYEAMNGPHTWFLHRDEIELARRNAFEEADNITKSGVTTDGRTFKAHDVLTSTRKKARGLVQELLDQCEDAEKAGVEPPYKVYKWGVAETVQNVPNCRYHAPPGTPEEDLCPCPKYVNGFLGDKKTPRTLEHVCGGRFGRSDGWRPLEPDIASKFTKNSPAMWDAQQECKKVASEGLILRNFEREIQGIRKFVFDPQNGDIYNSSDFGGSNPFSSHWYQVLNRHVSVESYGGEWKVLQPGNIVVFSEFYKADIGNNDFFAAIKAREQGFLAEHESFEITERYADIANRAARTDMLNYEGYPMPTQWHLVGKNTVGRDVEEHIKLCNEAVDKQEIYVDVDTCPMWLDEAEAWQRDPNTGNQIDAFNHAMSDFRYFIANFRRKQQIEASHGGGTEPAAAESSADRNPLTSLPETGPATASHDDLPPGIPLHRRADRLPGMPPMPGSM